MMADIVSASSPEAARRVLATERIDLAIVDVRLGAEPGLDLLPHLRDPSGKIIPVIIFSNSDQKWSEDDQPQPPLSRTTSPLTRLGPIVRDRLGLSPPLSVRQVA
ncbi:CheY-like chemotaxis protein [Bradyrhizobium sp. USDA 4353]